MASTGGMCLRRSKQAQKRRIGGKQLSVGTEEDLTRGVRCERSSVILLSALQGRTSEGLTVKGPLVDLLTLTGEI